MEDSFLVLEMVVYCVCTGQLDIDIDMCILNPVKNDGRFFGHTNRPDEVEVDVEVEADGTVQRRPAH